MKYTKAEVAESLDYLYTLIPQNATVHTILRKVSRSGMLRYISVVFLKDGQAQDVTFHVARVGGYVIDRDLFALKVTGCGMDMGFHVVYNLSYSLFGKAHVCNGIDSGPDRCHSNDHSNGMKFEKGVSHSDGGYALNHRWL